MEHRGACSADQISGDGAGLMTHIPWEVIQKDIPSADASSCGCVLLEATSACLLLAYGDE
jgi:glutamate synthase domain-containing protein 1